MRGKLPVVGDALEGVGGVGGMDLDYDMVVVGQRTS